MRAELGVERNKETPPLLEMAATQVWATEQQNPGKQMECGQDYQLHMSCSQGKSSQEAGYGMGRKHSFFKTRGEVT
jgi:hypothetical protein